MDQRFIKAYLFLATGFALSFLSAYFYIPITVIIFIFLRKNILLSLIVIGFALGLWINFSYNHESVSSFGQAHPKEALAILNNDIQSTYDGKILYELRLIETISENNIRTSAVAVINFKTAKPDPKLKFSQSLARVDLKDGKISAIHFFKNPAGIFNLRARFLEICKVDPLLKKSAAWNFWYALVLGRQDFVDPFTKEIFRDAGALHILALSGGHLSLLAGLIFFILGKFMGKAKSIIISLLLCIIFVFIVGPFPSVLRALLFFLLTSLSKIISGRMYLAENALLTIPLSLFIFPELFGELGFWLSVFCIIGLVFLFRPISNFVRRYIGPILGPSISLGLSTSLASGPVLLIEGLPFRPAALISGIVLVPLTIFYMILGFIPPLANLLLDPCFHLIQNLGSLFVFGDFTN